MSVFFRFKVPVNMIKPLGLLSEVDLFSQWIPGILKSDIKNSLSDFRKVLYIEREFPYPFAPRQLLLGASAQLVKEKKGALISIRSINFDERCDTWGADQDVLKERPEIVVAKMIRGFMYIEKNDDESCWYHGLMNVDPMFGFIPYMMINFMVKRIVYLMIGKIQNKEVFENEIVMQRMSERTEFYETIKKRLDEFDK